jgi:hypothetical protein
VTHSGTAIGVSVAAALFCAGCGTTGPAGQEATLRMRPSRQAFDFNTTTAKKNIDRFLDSRKGRSGLTVSFMGTSPYIFSIETGRFHEYMYGEVGSGDDQAFTYDVSLAAMGMLLNGRQAEAEWILDALQKDFYLPKNGRYGLYNAYLASSRLPYDELSLGADGDRMHTGPMLWVAFAALNHAKLVRNTRYLDFALDMVDWCRTQLTYYRFPDGERGAVSMGHGWGPDWNKIFSTEHNVDYYAVLRMLRAIHAESGPEVRAIFDAKDVTAAWLDDEMAHIARWLKDVAFDEERYVFRAGVNQFGVDALRVLDGTSWGLAGCGPETFVAMGIDIERLIENTEKHFTSSYVMEDGRVIRGFDITDPDGYEWARAPLVWFEGTGQMIIAYAETARYFERLGDQARAKKYFAKARQYTEWMNDFSEHYGLRSTLPYMSIRPEPMSIVKTLKWEWEIPRGRNAAEWVCSMSSTMWFLYSMHDFYNTMGWN